MRGASWTFPLMRCRMIVGELFRMEIRAIQSKGRRRQEKRRNEFLPAIGERAIIVSLTCLLSGSKVFARENPHTAQMACVRDVWHPLIGPALSGAGA